MSIQSERAWPWLVDAAVVLYVAWVCRTLAVRVPEFHGIFSGLGAQLPDATSLVIRVCTAQTLYMLAAVIALALIAKNLLWKSTIGQLGISVLAILFVSWSSSVVTEALMQPMLHLMTQIGK